MRPCHNYFLSFHIQNKVFHFTPLTQYIIVSHHVAEPFGLQRRFARHTKARRIAESRTRLKRCASRFGLKIVAIGF